MPSERSDKRPKSRHVLCTYRWALGSSGSAINTLAWPGWRLHPGTEWRCSRARDGLSYGRLLRGLARGRAIRWAHLCFLLLGSGSGDWAVGKRSQHSEHQATAGCQRPQGHHQDFLQPCLATINGPFLPTCLDCFFLVARIWAVRLITLFHQLPCARPD